MLCVLCGDVTVLTREAGLLPIGCCRVPLVSGLCDFVRLLVQFLALS